MAVPAFPLTLLAGAAMMAACGSAGHSGQPDSTNAATAATATTAAAPRADTFKGAITEATGQWVGDHGRVTVVLTHPSRATNPSTSLKLSIRGAGCGGRSHCLRLQGQVSGRMTALHSLADVGHRFDVNAGGTVTPLGHVKASGIAAGTGFILTGHTELNVTLRSASGSVTVAAQSGPVPGRTDP